VVDVIKPRKKRSLADLTDCPLVAGKPEASYFDILCERWRIFLSNPAAAFPLL
jgi:hypothetical protein